MRMILREAGLKGHKEVEGHLITEQAKVKWLALCKRLIFASDPQDGCTSIPVFTRASHRRLYFGNVYNAPGYISLNAYAFAEPCTCEGACCGKVVLKEFVRARDDYVYRPPPQPLPPSDVDQQFYVVREDG
ncbi:hypothetical protein Y032_0067g69 [Ancylostoma ceylanicum]|nr:hypothetical protein Y032_0067g69 [Ancylostoma ceylanicum]